MGPVAKHRNSDERNKRQKYEAAQFGNPVARSRKRTCPLKDSGWKTTFLLKWPPFGGHDGTLLVFRCVMTIFQSIITL